MSNRGNNSGATVGVVRALYRYPVKSMRGEALDEARLSAHGFAGDRRYAFVRTGNTSSFPWFTARQVPALLRYAPYFAAPDDPERSPIRVRTPDAGDLPLESDELRGELADAFGAAIHLTHAGRGTFDCAPVSIISLATVRGLGERVGADLDPRRFRPNVLVETPDGRPFAEDGWLGGLLLFGERDDSALVRADERDPRCMMINLDPDRAEQQPAVLREVARTNETCAGIYGAVERPGTITVGDVVRLIV